MSTRCAAVAGQFYPSDAKTLRRMVEEHLDGADVSAAPELVTGVLAPHAGYPYSGPTAGHSYARVRGKRPKRVVLLGRSHRYTFSEASLFSENAFETPLGSVAVDLKFVRDLVGAVGENFQEPHVAEHGLEVQLPFLQVALGDVVIVPILFGSDPSPWHVEFGERLAERLDEEDLVVVSTDLSHYLSEVAANEIDQRSLDGVVTGDCDAYIAGVEAGTFSMCGASAVVASMACAVARGAGVRSLLDYRTSGVVTGDYERVVGYGAVSMERGGI